MRIVTAAARAIREEGLASPRLADLMRTAGLTHGGFYRHFPSREALMAEALEHAFKEGQVRIAARAREGDGPEQFLAIVELYLTKRHRDHPGAGCALGAMAADIGRAGEAMRGLCRREVEEQLALLGDTLRGDEIEARRRSIVALCLFIGALQVSRAVGDSDLSDEVLDVIRDFLPSLNEPSEPRGGPPAAASH
jgi:TetR/AcrR family transcriptional repressor of nem operon